MIMKTGKRFIDRFLWLLMLTISPSCFVMSQNWQIGDGYSVSFSGSEISGIFKGLKGNIFFNEQDITTSRFDITIDVGSINTGNGLQNRHAKSEEWLDASKYPVIRYVSQKIAKTGNTYQATGYLDVHGIKKMVIIPFAFRRKDKGAVFSGTFTLNRSDFNIGKPGGDVAELIKIDLTVPVVPK